MQDEDSNSTSSFSYKRGRQSGHTRNGPTLGGRLVTIYGKEFEAKHPTTAYVRLEVRDLWSASVLSISRTRSWRVNTRRWWKSSWCGRFGGKSAERGAQDCRYDPPVVTHIEPARGHTYGGYNLTIEGQNFGVDQAVSVSVGKSPCCEIKKIIDSSFASCLLDWYEFKVIVDHLGNHRRDEPRSFDSPVIKISYVVFESEAREFQ